MSVTEVKASDRVEVLGVQQFDKEEQAAIRDRMRAIDLLTEEATKGRAKYKIELFFTQARSVQAPTVGILSFWESGARLHGGGDTKLYICPGREKQISQCQAFIPDSGNSSSILFCPACGTSWKGADTVGEHVAKLTMQKWSELLVHYYARLEHNADIYVKHAKEDLRTKAMIEQARQKGGEVLAKVRDKRAIVLYPLANIIKDTAAGASLESRFKALLSA